MMSLGRRQRQRQRQPGFHSSSSRLLLLRRRNSSCRHIHSSSSNCVRGDGDGAVTLPPSSSVTTVVVTRNNFRSLLDTSIRRHIRGADFLSIHACVTGTSASPWRWRSGKPPHPFQTLDTSYHNLRDSAQRFAMLELGLCAFSWRGSQFVAKPFNFYLFPQDDQKLGVDNDSFLCETASLEAMANTGFNFNTCIQHGISYMSRDQESVAGTKVGFEPEDYAGVQMFGKIRQRCSNDVEMTPADKMFSQHIRNKILKWLCENNEGCRTLNGDVYQSIQGESDLRSAMYKRLSNSHVIWYKSYEPPGLLRASMKWESLGHHELLVLLEVIQLDYKDLVAVVQPESPSSRNKNVHIFYVASEAERVLLLEELEQGENKEKERQLVESIGFRHVIDCIVESEKVVVGHHCILDFLHIFRSFFKPLPLNVSKFSSMLSEHFPCIIDTKYLAKEILHLDKDSTLENLYLKLCCDRGKKSLKVSVETSDVLVSNRAHSERQRIQTKICNSGNKAYMAGCLFAHMCDVTSTDPCEIKQFVDTDNKKGIRKHVNMLYLNTLVPLVLDLSTGYEVNSIVDLKRQTDDPNVLVALLWGYTSGTTLLSLQSAINQALKAENLVDIYPLDDSSALARFSSAEAMEQFLAIIERYGKLHGVGGLRVARFAAYEFLCKYAPSMHKLADCAESMNLGSSQLKQITTTRIIL